LVADGFQIATFDYSGFGHLITYPRAGHGSHHQYPEVATTQIAAFVKGNAQGLTIRDVRIYNNA
jgi:predicted alpha/beta hydrolase